MARTSTNSGTARALFDDGEKAEFEKLTKKIETTRGALNSLVYRISNRKHDFRPLQETELEARALVSRVCNLYLRWRKIDEMGHNWSVTR